MDRTNQNGIRNRLAPRASLLAPRGFTLIELLVVITIIGILAALITVAAVGALKTAQRTRIKAEINEISNALDEYKNKTTAYPPNCQTDDTTIGGAETALAPLDEAAVLNDLMRHFKQAFPRRQESDNLLRAIAGLPATGTDAGSYTKKLDGGMTAGEAVVFWLGGFSADPKYPISGEGGPSYSIAGVTAAERAKVDPIESRKWVFPFDVTRLAQRDSSGYFDESAGRYVEYTDPKGVLRRINFWQYAPAKSDQPYLYFDTSRHPAGVLSGTTLLGTYDPPAATLTSKLGPNGDGLHVHAFKKVNPSYTTATASSVPAVVFVNPDKFQVMHCGLGESWDTAAFEKMSPHDVKTNKPDDYLLFPTGPFIGDVAETEVNFTQETKIEDAQK